MTLEEALSCMQKCKIPELADYSNLQKIDTTEFYFPPPFKLTRKDENSRFILFSAPGAVGKTALAKYIAHRYGGLYWNIAPRPVAGTAFAGEIAHAVGTGQGARMDSIFQDLKRGKNLFVLDAFDEAALVSRRDGVRDFLTEIGELLSGATSPSVVLTARTDMAQFILEVCDKNDFGVTCYDIDYFEESDSVQFIVEYLKSQKIQVGPVQEGNIQNYLNAIKLRIGSAQDQRSFIGYAQVLSILAKRVEVEARDNPLLNDMVLTVSGDSETSIIFSIIQELIVREKNKLNHFKEKIREKYIPLGKEEMVNSLYDKTEQLVRLQWYVATKNISLDDYASCHELLPDDKKEYLALLNDWVPQHVFLQNGKVMPVFSDYMLAECLLDSDLSLFSDQYQSRLPTRAFMDCYLSLNNNCVNSEHIYYIDLAYSSQTTTGCKAYCDISPSNDDATGEDETLNLCLTLVDVSGEKETSTSFKIIRMGNAPIRLCRAENMSVSVDGKVILTPSFLADVTIRQSSIECDELDFNANEVVFETYGDEVNSIIVRNRITRLPGGKITIKGSHALRVDFPKDQIDQYKRLFYELFPYSYSFSDEAEGSDDIEHFTYAVKKALEQFKIDNYGGDPAKHKEKIDARCHTGYKAQVLAFFKDIGLIYEDGIMYKASLSKMSDLKISRVAFTHGKYDQLQYACNQYKEWFNKQKYTST